MQGNANTAPWEPRPFAPIPYVGERLTDAAEIRTAVARFCALSAQRVSGAMVTADGTRDDAAAEEEFQQRELLRRFVRVGGVYERRELEMLAAHSTRWDALPPLGTLPRDLAARIGYLCVLRCLSRRLERRLMIYDVDAKAMVLEWFTSAERPRYHEPAMRPMLDVIAGIALVPRHARATGSVRTDNARRWFASTLLTPLEDLPSDMIAALCRTADLTCENERGRVFHALKHPNCTAEIRWSVLARLAADPNRHPKVEAAAGEAIAASAGAMQDTTLWTYIATQWQTNPDVVRWLIRTPSQPVGRRVPMLQRLVREHLERPEHAPAFRALLDVMADPEGRLACLALEPDDLAALMQSPQADVRRGAIEVLGSDEQMVGPRTSPATMK